ncbi:MAG: hypothetical protein IIW94_05595 [Clostridia bacterium]|nr:hypothetical protein [Clostridia bacterium]
MKKKQLIEKMVELIDTINSLQHQLNEVKTENKELKEKLVLLEQQPENTKMAVPEPVKTEGFTVDTEALDSAATAEVAEEMPAIEVNDVKLADSTVEYGSVIIGKIVVESVKYANLIGESNSENKKELLNLIMGKAEVAKAEIFAITESEATDEVKKELIDAQYAEALDYFKSAYGQITE